MALPKLKLARSLEEIDEVIASCMQEHARHNGELSILEAGCGQMWPFRRDLPYRLTGVDTDARALESRKRRKNDLDEAILGDLRSVDLPPRSYDIIYSSFVLEHVQGAELVLQNFLKWLKPSGLMILLFPDRSSVYGFFTRTTPFWFHVVYKKYIVGIYKAGQPGFGPYPTFHDQVISRKSFHEFLHVNDLEIREEYGFSDLPPYQVLFTRVIEALSLGKLASDHTNLLYVLQLRNSNDNA